MRDGRDRWGIISRLVRIQRSKVTIGSDGDAGEDREKACETNSCLPRGLDRRRNEVNHDAGSPVLLDNGAKRRLAYVYGRWRDILARLGSPKRRQNGETKASHLYFQTRAERTRGNFHFIAEA